MTTSAPFLQFSAASSPLDATAIAALLLFAAAVVAVIVQIGARRRRARKAAEQASESSVRVITIGPGIGTLIALVALIAAMTTAGVWWGRRAAVAELATSNRSAGAQPPGALANAGTADSTHRASIEESRAPQYLLAAVLGVIALACLILMVHESAETPPAIESHWGGLGAGQGGWQVSSSMVYLICTIAFAAMATAATLFRPASTAEPPHAATATRSDTGVKVDTAHRASQQAARP